MSSLGSRLAISPGSLFGAPANFRARPKDPKQSHKHFPPLLSASCEHDIGQDRHSKWVHYIHDSKRLLDFLEAGFLREWRLRFRGGVRSWEVAGIACNNMCGHTRYLKANADN